MLVLLQSHLEVGDYAIVKYSDISTIEKMQKNHGGWNSSMKELLKRPSQICSLKDSDVVVKTISGNTYRLNKKLLSKYSISKQFKIGSIVEIISDEQQIKKIMGPEWDGLKEMKEIVGKKVEIGQIFDDGDVHIKYNGKIFTINEQCFVREKRKHYKRGDLIRISSDIQQTKLLQNMHGGWFPFMKLLSDKSGKVLSVLKNGDVLVNVNEVHIFYNRKLVSLLNDKRKDSDDSSDSENSDKENHMVELFFAAIQMGDLGMVQNMVNVLGSNVKTKNTYPILVATHRGHVDIVKYLLKNKADVNAKDREGDTALHLATVKKNIEICRLLIDNGANLNFRNNQKLSPIMLAAAMEAEDILELFASQSSIDLNLKGLENATALHLAVQKNNKNCTEILLKFGADPRATGRLNLTPFHLAAMTGDRKILEIFLKKEGESIVNLQKDDKFTALHLAAINKNTDCLKLLIEYKADLNICNCISQTALHTSIFVRHLESVKLLVENNANLNIKDESGDTPLHFGIRADNTDLLKNGLPLIGRYILPSDKGDDKLEDIVTYLAKHGARLDITNTSGLTPIDLCLNESLKKKLLLIQAEEENKKMEMEKAAADAIRVVKSPEEELLDLRRREKELLNEKLCVVCRDRLNDTVLGCGHKACNNCASNLLECQICKSIITQRVKILE